MTEAKRFGGAHSPENARTTGPAPMARPASRFSGRKARRFSWRILGLYLAPSALVLAGLEAIISADLFQLLWSWGIYGVLMLAAWLTGQGMRAADAFDERIVAKPPAFPRKLVAAILTGGAVAGLCLIGAKVGIALSVIYGAVAAGAHVATFGIDPMRAKGGVGLADAELDRVAAKLDQAEAVVAETVKVAETLKDPSLAKRIDALAYAARDILREIQTDPCDLRRSRQFLSVHLVGLRDATIKFATARAKGGATSMRGEYEGLLVDLEASFANQRKALLTNDETALEVEIEVLRGRLRQEGAL